MRLNQLIIGILISLLMLPAFALESDATQAIKIEADKMQLDERKGITKYEGNVKLVQGSLSLTADFLEMTTKDGKLQHIRIAGTPSQPASFKQTTEAGQTAHGQAQKMDFSANKSRLVLTGQAELTQGNNFIRSERIDYNTLSNSLYAGKNGSQQSDSSTDGRVHMVITPDQP